MNIFEVFHADEQNATVYFDKLLGSFQIWQQAKKVIDGVFRIGNGEFKNGRDLEAVWVLVGDGACREQD